MTVNGVEIPFDFEIVNTSGALTGSFFNGERRITSTASRVEGNHIVFTFAQYAAALEATLQADGLSGEYRRDARLNYPFRAVPATTKDIRDEGGPPIAGLWNVQVKSSKGESAWRLIVRQTGAVSTAAILRVDGDTGTLTGTLSRRQVRAEPFLGRASAAARAHAGSRRHAVARAERTRPSSSRSAPSEARAEGARRSRAIRRASPA